MVKIVIRMVKIVIRTVKIVIMIVRLIINFSESSVESIWWSVESSHVMMVSG